MSYQKSDLELFMYLRIKCSHWSSSQSILGDGICPLESIMFFPLESLSSLNIKSEQNKQIKQNYQLKDRAFVTL